jgi:hypothetical protein
VTLLNASPIEAERIAGDWFDALVIRYREMWQVLQRSGLYGLTPDIRLAFESTDEVVLTVRKELSDQLEAEKKARQEAINFPNNG